MLKQRLIFGFLGALAVIGIIVFCPTEAVGAILGVITLIALGEFYNVTGLFSKKSPFMLLGFAYCLVLFIGVIIKPELVFDYAILSIVIYVFLLMSFMVLFRSKCSFSDCALSFIGSMYISVFFAHILLIRQLEPGKILIWILFISAWGTDTFAYFAGRLFGKHKLCPGISPKKTVEGAIGGTLGCIMLVCIYAYIISLVNNYQVNWLNIVVISTLSAVFSQIGDLAASCIKRENGAKDYSNLIPGHGGILDRFDSVLLISPLVYNLLMYLPVLK